jgi:hypothetical protein
MQMSHMYNNQWKVFLMINWKWHGKSFGVFKGLYWTYDSMNIQKPSTDYAPIWWRNTQNGDRFRLLWQTTQNLTNLTFSWHPQASGCYDTDNPEPTNLTFSWHPQASGCYDTDKPEPTNLNFSWYPQTSILSLGWARNQFHSAKICINSSLKIQLNTRSHSPVFLLFQVAPFLYTVTCSTVAMQRSEEGTMRCLITAR